MSRNYQLPQGKRIHVYRSGDSHFEGIKINFNPNLYKKQEKFLDAVSEKVPMMGAVRSIHTPSTGREVTNFTEFERDLKYVAAGPKGFVSIPGGYENIGKQHFADLQKKDGRPIKIVKSIRLKKSKTVWVYRNGDDKSKSQAFTVSGENPENWTNFLYRVSERVKIPLGVAKLYDIKGKIVDSVESLEDSGQYVATSAHDLFRPLAYAKIGKDVASRKLASENIASAIKSPGLKVRIPKNTSFREKKSISLIESGGLTSNASPNVSPSSSRRSRSESRTRKKKTRKSRRNNKNKNNEENKEEDDEEYDEDLDNSPLRNSTERQSRARNLANSTLNVSTPIEGISGAVSPEHLYETLSKIEIGDMNEIRGRNAADEDEIGFEEEELPDEDEDEEGSSGWDSGRGSIFIGEEDRHNNLFKAKHKSRPTTTMAVDYDTDEGGIFRAKSRSEFTRNAKTVLEDSKTKIEVPIDLVEAKEVMEEVY